MFVLMYKVLLYAHPFPPVAADCEKTIGSDLVQNSSNSVKDVSDLVEDGSDKGTHNETDTM